MKPNGLKMVQKSNLRRVIRIVINSDQAKLNSSHLFSFTSLPAQLAVILAISYSMTSIIGASVNLCDYEFMICWFQRRIFKVPCTETYRKVYVKADTPIKRLFLALSDFT